MQDGGYRVRGTVRDKNNEAKVAPLREAFGEHFNRLELVEADLLNEESLIAAMAGATYVCHVASPFFMSDDAEQLITPALKGTEYVMNACKQAGVKRCVITSSIASVSSVAEADKPADRVYNEGHWSNPDRPEGMSNYGKSKVLAERKAWEMQAAMSESEKFEIVTICPGFVMGPPLRKENFTSGGWLKRLMEGTTTSISSDSCGAVDVRDVARAHVLGIKNPAAANRRFILVQATPTF